MKNLPKTMKAAILVEQKKPLIIANIGLPEKLELGQVLVKINCSGVCGSQLGEIDGAKGPDKYLPHLLGHEAKGQVLAIGPGVQHISIDDHVVLHWRKSQGINAQPPKYKWGDKVVNAGQITTFNEFAIVSENRLTRVNPAIDENILSLFGCAITTGFGVIENEADIQIGQSVVVFGAGGVGLNMIQAAKLRNAHPIIAVDQFDNRLELARLFGADYTINGAKQDAFKSIKNLTNDRKLDVFIDNTGNVSIIEHGLSLTSSKGKVVLVGVPKSDSKVSFNTLPLHFGKQIFGTEGGKSDPQHDIPRYLKMYENGIINFDGLISKEFDLEDINGALNQMRDGSISGRIIIKMG